MSHSWSVPAGQRLGGAIVQTRAHVWALESSSASPSSSATASAAATHAVLRWPRSAARLDPSSAARCAVPHALHAVLAAADAPDAVVLIGARGEVSVLSAAAGSGAGAGSGSGKDAGSALTAVAAPPVHQQANANAADDVVVVDAQVQAVGAELIITCVRFGRASSSSSSVRGYVLDVWSAPANAQSAPTHVASFALRGDHAAAPVAPFVAAASSSAAASAASSASAAAATAGRPKKGGKKAAAAVAEEADAMVVSADNGAASIACGPALLSFAAHWPSRQLSLCFADGRWAVVAFAAHGSLTAALRGGNKLGGSGSSAATSGGPLLRCSRAMRALTMSADAQTLYAPLDRYGLENEIHDSVWMHQQRKLNWKHLCTPGLFVFRIDDVLMPFRFSILDPPFAWCLRSPVDSFFVGSAALAIVSSLSSSSSSSSSSAAADAGGSISVWETAYGTLQSHRALSELEVHTLASSAASVAESAESGAGKKRGRPAAAAAAATAAATTSAHVPIRCSIVPATPVSALSSSSSPSLATATVLLALPTAVHVLAVHAAAAPSLASALGQLRTAAPLLLGDSSISSSSATSDFSSSSSSSSSTLMSLSASNAAASALIGMHAPVSAPVSSSSSAPSASTAAWLIAPPAELPASVWPSPVAAAANVDEQNAMRALGIATAASSAASASASPSDEEFARSVEEFLGGGSGGTDSAPKKRKKGQVCARMIHHLAFFSASPNESQLYPLFRVFHIIVCLLLCVCHICQDAVTVASSSSSTGAASRPVSWVFANAAAAALLSRTASLPSSSSSSSALSSSSAPSSSSSSEASASPLWSALAALLRTGHIGSQAMPALVPTLIRGAQTVRTQQS